MPPKIDPNTIVTINVRCIGGEAGAVSSLAPKVGPLGLSPKKVSDDIAKASSDWKGLKITCQLTVQNRVAKVAVLPSAAALVIKALKEPQRDRKKVKHVKHDGNLSLDEIYEIARVMRPKSNAKTYQGTVLEVLGSCVSVGCKVEGQSPKEVQRKIKDGELETPEK
eukprot:gnl/Spiro4/16415_TR8819_c0_g1_i1.p1 gnl/Spiro4/16415_TR8819_c0_g1~~gnl/Spiro4/16415_TR8819_c0_g1_i1.p1  ORF type:complete len:166 (-),score=3.04 gnl/Spiro4/16415_TR8819_c0_g1_i1:71-568(-)